MTHEKDAALIVGYTILERIEAWFKQAQVWLDADSTHRQTLPDPSTIKPEPFDRMLRSSWYSVAGKYDGSDEYQILLTAHRPSIRITGRLSKYEALTVEMEWQSVLGNSYWNRLPLDIPGREALLAYANSFSWG